MISIQSLESVIERRTNGFCTGISVIQAHGVYFSQWQLSDDDFRKLELTIHEVIS